MAHVRIDFQGRRKIETFAGTRVQPIGDGVQPPLGGARQVGALRQVLAQQPIRVFIRAALPRAVGGGKEHLNLELLRQARMFGHFFALIVRQGFPQRGRPMPECRGEALPGTRGIRPVHSGQENQAVTSVVNSGRHELQPHAAGC